MAKFDLAILGTGPAGQRAAIEAAALGKSVVIFERREVVGGVCLHTGTIPSKTLREAVIFLSGINQRAFYGADFSVKKSITMEDLLFRTSQVIQREMEIVRAEMHKHNVTMVHGNCRIASQDSSGIFCIHLENYKNQVDEFLVDNIVVATGTVPSRPADIPFDGNTIIDTDQLLQLKQLPKTMAIFGAGVIGTEYACIFATLGVQITLISKGEQLLPFAEKEVIDALIYHMRDLGVTLRLNEPADRFYTNGTKAVIDLKSGKQISADIAVIAIGREGNTSSLGLENIGIKTGLRSLIEVDDTFRTSNPKVFACGDVIGFPALASTAMEQGRCAGREILGYSSPMAENFPYGIYSIPEISMIGPTEEELTRKGVIYETGIAKYRETARGQILGDHSGVLKLIFDPNTLKLISVHIIGTSATELIHVGQSVMEFNGTIEYFVKTIFNYPTLAECYRIAALQGLNKIHRT